MEINPDDVWFGLCQNREDAKRYCQTFLRSYAENSVRRCICLGPAEYEWKRVVTSASTVLHTWKSLVGRADRTVLQERRRDDPENKSLWTLKFTELAGHGPVHEITMLVYSSRFKKY